MENYSKCDVFGVIFAAFGVVAGFMGFPIFMFVCGNVQASIWAFISGFFAACVLFLLGSSMLNEIDRWSGPTRLFNFGCLGVVGAIISFAFSIVYVVDIINLHEGIPTMSTFGTSHLIMAVWSLMTLKWSLSTIYMVRRNNRLIRSGYQQL